MKRFLITISIAAAAVTAATAALTVGEYVNTVNPASPVRHTATDFLIIGSPDTARAVSPYKGNPGMAGRYSGSANKLRRALPATVRLYCMPVPSSSEFYTPVEAQEEWYTPQSLTINAIFAGLDEGITPVNAYDELAAHVCEPVYSRTDHHWQPLGAYYAARAFAATAGVPFLPLDDAHYATRVVPEYVGSMARYTKDAAVKASPEDFVYYTPLDTSYTVLRDVYTVKGQQVTERTGFEPSQFFFTYKGGLTYCTFMGGDYNATRVTTGVGNGRRLLIIKDSFGNALPPFLFASFEQIDVVDFRWFGGNVVDYAIENGITDVLMVNVVEIAVSTNIPKRYDILLESAK